MDAPPHLKKDAERLHTGLSAFRFPFLPLAASFVLAICRCGRSEAFPAPTKYGPASRSAHAPADMTRMRPHREKGIGYAHSLFDVGSRRTARWAASHPAMKMGFPSTPLSVHNLEPAARGELIMAKTMRRKTKARAAKPAKAAAKTNRATSKTRGKAASPQKAKAAALKKPQAAAPQAKPAAKTGATPRESLGHRIGGAFKAVIDTLSDAEHLHHQLDPDPTKDFDPE